MNILSKTITHIDIKKVARYRWQLTIHQVGTTEDNEIFEGSEKIDLNDKDHRLLYKLWEKMEAAQVYGKRETLDVGRTNLRPID